MGRVCEKHQQFYETECRWCEPPAASRESAAFWRTNSPWAPQANTQQIQTAMDECWAQMARAQQQAQQQAVWMPTGYGTPIE